MKFLNAIGLASTASLLIVSSIANAQQQCRLCGDNTKVVQVDSCKENDVQQVTLNTCCASSDDLSQCVDQRACRYVELSQKLGCGSPGEAQQECAGEPSQTFELVLELDIENHPAECCSSCNCAGDPHCSDFEKKHDEWILCDGRDTTQNCDITKTVCEQQTDQANAQCIFSNGKCAPNPLSPSVQMLLYQKGDVSITVTLGIRGIIEDIIIKEKKNVLSLSAVDCKKNPVAPWVGTPISTLTRRKNGLKWDYNIPTANAGVTVDCVYSGTLVSDPHLDVTISDSTGQGKPPGVSGFCAGDAIPKTFSHANTDMIAETGVCMGKNRNYIAAKYFAGDKVKSDQDVRKAAKKFCYKYIAGYNKNTVGSGSGGSKKVKLCFKNIVGKGERPGWAAAFCAANLLVSKNAADCPSSIECKTCTSDIEDFGWDYAVSKYDKTKKTPPVAGPTCVDDVSKLPDDLLGCERGIRIQYKINDEWKTFKGIPYGTTICKSSGFFNSNNAAVLFQNPIRIAQCGDVYNSECSNLPTTKCTGQDSFTARISSRRIPGQPQFGIVDLVEKGILICKDKKNPTACFDIPFVPCKACKGICPVMEWKPPCTDCAMCPA